MAVDDGRSDNVCSIHGGSKVVLYCKSCEALICTRCISQGQGGDGGKHRDHVYLDLLEAYNIGQEELEKMIAGFRDDLQTKRVEKQELHTRLQKLQLGLLRKRTELLKATRSLKDGLWKKERSFLGRVDAIVQPAIAQCQQRFKDVEFDVVCRDGLLANSEAVLKLPPSRILSFLKSMPGLKREITQIRRRTFTEYDEASFNLQRLESVHLNLTREKQLVDLALSFPSTAPEAPRILSSWCVIGHVSASLVWKYNRNDMVKAFYVYYKERTFSDRKILQHCERKVKIAVEKIPKKRQTQKQRHKAAGVKSKRWQTHTSSTSSDTRRSTARSTKQYVTGSGKQSRWRRLYSWLTRRRGDATLTAAAATDTTSDASRDQRDSSTAGLQATDDVTDTTGSPPWYVVEPVNYVESLSGEEQHIHDSLNKSMALTEALRKRSEGLRKKASVSDQYLYTPVFRPRSEHDTSLFGAQRSSLNQTAIKERFSQEKLHENDAKDESALKDRSEVSQQDAAAAAAKLPVTKKEHYHTYAAVNLSKIDTAGFQRIKLSRFIPGRIPVCLRQLRPGTQYIVMLAAVNQNGESEAVVMDLRTGSSDAEGKLNLNCKAKNKLELCKSVLKSTFTTLFCSLIVGFYAFLILYLLSGIFAQKMSNSADVTSDDITSFGVRDNDVNELDDRAQWTSEQSPPPPRSLADAGTWLSDVTSYLTGASDYE